jgi:hypothetical protein
LLAIAAVVVACKVDEKAPPAPVPADEKPAPAPVVRAPIKSLVPEIAGAKVLQIHERTDTQVFMRWCIDEADAAKRVMDTLTRDGWTEVVTRGTGDRLGVAANKGDARFSASVGGTDEACGGSLVTGTIMRLGAIRVPAVEDRVS